MAALYALDFSPLTSAIESNQQYGLQQQRQQNENTRLGFERELQPGRVKQQSQAIDQNQLDYESKLAGHFGAFGDAILGETDPAKKQNYMNQIVAHPGMKRMFDDHLPPGWQNNPDLVGHYTSTLAQGSNGYKDPVQQETERVNLQNLKEQSQRTREYYADPSQPAPANLPQVRIPASQAGMGAPAATPAPAQSQPSAQPANTLSAVRQSVLGAPDPAGNNWRTLLNDPVHGRAITSYFQNNPDAARAIAPGDWQGAARAYVASAQGTQPSPQTVAPPTPDASQPAAPASPYPSARRATGLPEDIQGTGMPSVKAIADATARNAQAGLPTLPPPQAQPPVQGPGQGPMPGAVGAPAQPSPGAVSQPPAQAQPQPALQTPQATPGQPQPATQPPAGDPGQQALAALNAEKAQYQRMIRYGQNVPAALEGMKRIQEIEKSGEVLTPTGMVRLPGHAENTAFGKGLDETATANAKYYDSLYKGLAGSAMIAAQQRPNIDLLHQLMADPNFATGSLSNLQLGTQRALATFGPASWSASAAPREVFDQVMARVLGDQFSGLKSLSSEAGETASRIFAPMLAIEEKALANHDDSIEGIRQKVKILDETGQFMMNWGNMAAEYKAKNGGTLDPHFEKAIRDDIAKTRIQLHEGAKPPTPGAAQPEQPAAAGEKPAGRTVEQIRAAGAPVWDAVDKVYRAKGTDGQWHPVAAPAAPTEENRARRVQEASMPPQARSALRRQQAETRRNAPPAPDYTPQSFDADVQGMAYPNGAQPLDVARKYDPQRARLRPDQLRTLEDMIRNLR